MLVAPVEACSKFLARFSNFLRLKARRAWVSQEWSIISRGGWDLCNRDGLEICTSSRYIPMPNSLTLDAYTKQRPGSWRRRPVERRRCSFSICTCFLAREEVTLTFGMQWECWRQTNGPTQETRSVSSRQGWHCGAVQRTVREQCSHLETVEYTTTTL